MSEESSIPPAQAAAQTRWLDAYRAVAATLPRPTPTSAHVAHARELIDAELAGMHLLVSAMNERRNELTLPSLLPPEVLALVFSFLATVAPISVVSADYYKQRTMGWVSVSHVCRRWRNICLSQPSLWTRLTPDQHQPWRIFLERAKEASLFIEGPLKPHRDGTTRIRSILEHRHHIQELTLSDVQPTQLQELIHGLKGPLLRLRVLSLSRSSQVPNSSTSLPVGFLSDSAPNIQELTLFGILFPWGEGSPKITKFVYQHGSTSPVSSRRLSHTHTYSDVVHTLRQMPTLKSLKLFNVLPELAPAGVNAEAISLPLLQELSIRNDNDSCWHLWSQLRTPSSVCLSVEGTRITAVESLIVSTFRSHLQTCHNLGFSSMFIQLPIPTSGTVSLVLSDPLGYYKQRNDLHMPSHLRHPSITLNVSCSIAADMANQLIAGVALEDIRVLTCAGGRIGDPEVFRNTFLPAHSVTDLTLKHAAGSFLAALEPGPFAGSSSPRSESNSTASVERILFPDLRDLSCVEVNFAERIQYAGISTSMHDVLDNVLSSRSNDCGLTLEALYIVQCDVLEDWVDGWRDIVEEEVDWDEDEGDLAEPEDEEDEDQYFGYGDNYDDYYDWP
ncbi:hypothetical protein PENSPDRAFT_752661 [Peniophora sp. CONT]|nr:hypothetical protein PENSPDRAFT_752661 [Peniophora sp. CONT]